MTSKTNYKLPEIERKLIRAKDTIKQQHTALHKCVKKRFQLKQAILSMLDCEMCGGRGRYWADAETGEFEYYLEQLDRISAKACWNLVDCQCRIDARKAVGK